MAAVAEATLEDRAAQNLEWVRLAVPLMVRQAAEPSPVSFAVWFEHVAGRNRALSEDIQKLTANGHRLTETETRELHRKHIEPPDMAAAAQANESLRTLVAQTAGAVAQSQETTRHYVTSLQDHAKCLRDSSDGDTVMSQVSLILSDTEGVATAMSQLESLLDAQRAELDMLRRELEQVREQVFTDALTGLKNRRAFEDLLPKAVLGARRTGAPLSLVLIDIDHFKQVNDRFGHVTGDRVLQGIANAVQNLARETDVASRYGGEEFAIIMPGTTIEDATVLAEQLRVTVSKARVRRTDNEETIGKITISAGTASLRPGQEALSLVADADKALYAAKFAGRDRVMKRASDSTR
jgi:diguanylate cyclase